MKGVYKSYTRRFLVMVKISRWNCHVSKRIEKQRIYSSTKVRLSISNANSEKRDKCLNFNEGFVEVLETACFGNADHFMVPFVGKYECEAKVLVFVGDWERDFTARKSIYDVVDIPPFIRCKPMNAGMSCVTTSPTEVASVSTLSGQNTPDVCSVIVSCTQVPQPFVDGKPDSATARVSDEKFSSRQEVPVPALRDESLRKFSSVVESTEVPQPFERKPDEVFPSNSVSASALRAESQKKVTSLDGCQEAPPPCNPQM